MPWIKKHRDILPGECFGRWRVLGAAFISSKGMPKYPCACVCGKERNVLAYDLLKGKSRSCGCWSLDHSPTLTHGQARKNNTSAEYVIWCGIRKRCLNPKAHAYERYGGRGITVCERWNRFANFYEDMGPRPPGDYSIDRIDNDGPYSPENCHWATRSEQRLNRRMKRLYEFNGRIQTIAQWAREFHVDYYRLHSRLLKLGWPFEKAIAS